MKKQTLLLLTSLLFCIGSLFAQQSNEKTFVKSFNVEGYDVIDIEIDANYVVKKWDQSLMRIEMRVKVDSPNPNMIKMLTRTGRYFLAQKDTEDSTISILAPKLKNTLSSSVKEKIEMTVYAPQHITINTIEPSF